MGVIAVGRDSEIVDLGEGRVLRRFKRGGRPEREAEVMQHARAHGFPVPEVLEILDEALILQPINGPTMRVDLRRRPWRAVRHARTLAELHRRPSSPTSSAQDLARIRRTSEAQGVRRQLLAGGDD